MAENGGGSRETHLFLFISKKITTTETGFKKDRTIKNFTYNSNPYKLVLQSYIYKYHFFNSNQNFYVVFNTEYHEIKITTRR